MSFASLNPTTEITEVWESNGTSAGTQALRNFGDLGADRIRRWIVEHGEWFACFHQTYNSVTGDAQLWVTAGTTPSTLMLVDFGDLGSNTLGDLNQGLPAVESLGSETNVYGLVQTYNSFTGDVQLWVTDGTVAGTIMLNDFGGVPGPNGGPIYDVNATLSGIEMIQWYDPTTGSLELWVTNGTIAGTLMLHDFFEVGTSSIDFVGLAKNGAALLLINEFDIDLTELYASDGTVAGTKLLNDFIFSTVTPVTDLATGANVPGLFSSYNTFTSETQLWGTDGTPAGTSMLLSSSGVDNSVYFTRTPERCSRWQSCLQTTTRNSGALHLNPVNIPGLPWSGGFVLLSVQLF